MIPWRAYAPRRARDVGEWLRAKSVSSQDDLRRELLLLGIDPATFPQQAADAHWAGLCSTPAAEPIEAQVSLPHSEQAAPEAAPSAPLRFKKKRTAPPS